MGIKEIPFTYKVVEPALLKDGQKVVFWIDLILQDKVRIVSEYRDDDGVIHRTKEWLGEDDSLQWSEYK